MLKKVLYLLLMIVVFCHCKEKNQSENRIEGEKKLNIKIQSQAFDEGGIIPAKYTCDGANISPPLSWSNVPEGTRSFALICDDPDAPMGTWVHWVIFNIPANVNELPKNVPAQKTLSLIHI